MPEGDRIAPAISTMITYFTDMGATVFASRDYHPVDHASFVNQGGPFPAHCVQGTSGSYFIPPIAAALAGARKKRPNQVHVAFKVLLALV